MFKTRTLFVVSRDKSIVLHEGIVFESGDKSKIRGVGRAPRFRYDLGAVNIVLNEMEARVLGALLEKEITTPGYYPLSLNSLVNACNQKSNRDPVMSYDEETVLESIDGLRDKGLSTVI